MLHRAPCCLFAGLLAAAGGLLLFHPSPAGGCDTPVYRYAMYRWQPTPFEVYFFHQGEIGEADAAVEAALKERTGRQGAAANLIYLPVDLTEDAELVGVPPDVKQAFLAKENRELPTYMVVSPMGVKLFEGPLAADTVKQLVESPARKRTAELLAEGNACVLVMIDGSEKAANDEAEQAVKGVVNDVSAGKIKLYSGIEDQFPPATEENESPESEEETAEPPHTVAFLKVSRDDAKEEWFVRTLMSVERDLGEYVDQPMVFAVYGRGRALPPFIGKGVRRDNLVECVEFVTGACSCTVKEQNPGADLLFHCDWQAAADKLAEKYGSEEGNENTFGADAFFPDLIIPPAPPGSEPETITDDEPEDGDGEDPAGEDEVKLVSGDPGTDATDGQATADDPASVPADADPSDTDDETAPRDPASAENGGGDEKLSAGHDDPSREPEAPSEGDGERKVASAQPPSPAGNAGGAEGATASADENTFYLHPALTAGIVIAAAVLVLGCGSAVILMRRS